MASTFTNLNYHIVFATKYRKPNIPKGLQAELHKYTAGIIQAKKGRPLEINGTGDHVHILTGIPPTIAVADMVRDIKANSSKWMNERPDIIDRFAWQSGYSAFTVSRSQCDTVRKYIRNQETHHTKLSFEDEYLALLKRHGIEYDERYVFETEHHG